MPKRIKLTDIRRAVLIKLRNGSMITIDSSNMADLDGRPISPDTRYFLTQHRLIERFDNTKAVTTKGNGFVISGKGRDLLEMLERETPWEGKKDIEKILKFPHPDKEPATERQKSFMDRLGISYEPEISKAHASAIISEHIDKGEHLSTELQTDHNIFRRASVKHSGPKIMWLFVISFIILVIFLLFFLFSRNI